MRKILAIVRFTLLDALRSRLLLMSFIVVLILTASSLFLHELAITDGTRVQLGFLAPALRFTAMFIIAAFTVTTLQREFNERSATLILALDLARAHYVAGKILGFIAIGGFVALFFSLPLALWGEGARGWMWSLSLILEAAIVAAFAVFCATSLRGMTAALVLTLSFYFLAKTIAVLQLISHASLLATHPLHRYMNGALDLLALLLPRLDKFAQTNWLVDAVPAYALAPLAAQTLIFVALIGSATLIDIYRKNF